MRSAKDGFKPYCKPCARDHLREWNRKRGAKPRRTVDEIYPVPGMKRCSKCSVVKRLEDFCANRAAKDGRAVRCRDCARIARRKYRETAAGQMKEQAYKENNADKLAAYQARWAKDNPGARREYEKRWRDANPDKVREIRRQWITNNPDKYAAWLKRYRAENMAAYASRQALRRARKANAPHGDPHDAAAYSEILREGICELCGSTGPIHIDHIEALSIGGEHGWENFAGLCPSCNHSKNDEALLLHMLR